MADGIGSDLQGRRVLALLPSQGLGGGIESYFMALSEALADLGVELETVALQTPRVPRATLPTKARFALASLLAARRLARTKGSLLLVLHAGLFPVGVLAQSLAGFPSSRCALFFYGADIWGHSRVARGLARRAGWRVVTISSFSAGALVESGPVTMLPPGIPRARYERLVRARRRTEEPQPQVDVLSVFRLDSAESKGALALLCAGDTLRDRRSDFSLVIAGSGHAQPRLRDAVAQRHKWVSLKENLSFDDLADLYSTANTFVLATRSHQPGERGFRGEGFGIVLAEAQLAGTPVVAPCLGGSSDAFVEEVTGLRPADESPEALAASIERILGDDDLRRSMARDAQQWAHRRFSPDCYRRRLEEALRAFAE